MHGMGLRMGSATSSELFWEVEHDRSFLNPLYFSDKIFYFHVVSIFEHMETWRAERGYNNDSNVVLCMN